MELFRSWYKSAVEGTWDNESISSSIPKNGTEFLGASSVVIVKGESSKILIPNTFGYK